MSIALRLAGAGGRGHRADARARMRRRRLRVHAASASHSTVTTKSPERAWPARRTSCAACAARGAACSRVVASDDEELCRRASIPALARDWRRLPARAGSRSRGGLVGWQGCRRRCSRRVPGRQRPGRAASAPGDRWRCRRDSPVPLRAPPARERRSRLSWNSGSAPAKRQHARPMQGSHTQTEDLRDCR